MARTTDLSPPPPPSAGERGRAEAPHPPAFPGCRSFRLTRDAYEAYDGRIEYWDAATETAWAVADTSGAHERPSRGLAALCEVVASLRGGAIACRGSLDLVWNAGDRARRRILQADEVVWIYPGRSRIPDGGCGSACTTVRTSCWRSTTRPTSGAASSISTPRGASPKCASGRMGAWVPDGLSRQPPAARISRARRP